MYKKIAALSLVLIMIFSLTACGNSETEEKGDYLTGNKWESTSGMLLVLEKDETFKFYKDSSDKDDNYYSGTFEVINGTDAVEYMEEYYGFSADSQRSAMATFGVDEDYYYSLILTNEECIVDGENTLAEENEVAYFGYYTPDNEYLNLYNLNTMGQYEFYKK